MPKCKSAESASTEIFDAINSQMTDKNSDINVGIWQSRMNICNNYVLLFYANLRNIILEYKLTKTDIIVVLQMLEYMEYGNLLRVSYRKLAQDAGIDPKNINKTIKRLKDSNLLIAEEDGNTYLNPHVIAKGKFKSKDERSTKLLEYAAEIQNENIDISILTPRLKKQQEIKKEVEGYIHED